MSWALRGVFCRPAHWIGFCRGPRLHRGWPEILLRLWPHPVYMRARRIPRRPIMLSDPLFLLVAAACLTVAVILAMGISTFGKEGVENGKRDNKFMRWRIIAQFFAVVAILAVVTIHKYFGGQ